MSSEVPPKVLVRPHWKKRSLPFSIGSGRNFFPDSKGSQALRMAFFQSTLDDSLEGFIWFGQGIEGPPGHVHGGVSAYVLDEAMGSAAWFKGYPCVARNIKFELKRKTPIGIDFRIKAWVEKIHGTTITVRSKIFDDNGEFTSGFGEFHWLTREKLQDFLVQGPFPLDLDALNYAE